MSRKYIPILKWKKGEKIALQQLSDEVKKSIIPVIELTDMVEPIDFIVDLKEYYNLPIYLDTEIAAEDDIDYFISILDEAEKNNIIIYPVLNCNIIETINVTNFPNRLSIKIGVPEDIEGPSYSYIFKSIQDLFKNNPNLKIDILLNLGSITKSNDANNQFRDLKNIITDYFIGKNYYNSIIICSTSFPEDLANVDAGEKISYKRFDYAIFKKISTDFFALNSYLKYSDYGVTKFTDSDIDFRIMKYGVLPKLKYTCEDKYILWKGKRKKLSKELEISYFDLAKDLINSPYYYGKSFSYGDTEVYERYEKAKKQGTKKCGNGTTWVTISANHHICAVVEQLSK